MSTLRERIRRALSSRSLSVLRQLYDYANMPQTKLKRSGVPVTRYTSRMPSAKPRVQVTLDAELAAALTELGSTEPRARAIRDLALRGAEAIRAEQAGKRAALEHLHRIATGEDDRYDFSVSERLHAAR